MSDEKVAEFLSQAKALLFPGIEDFGIIPVEANSAGCPVIAYRKGGAIDSIKENVTGLFFDEQTTDSLVECIKKFEDNEKQFSDRESYTKHVKQFAPEEFIFKIKKLLDERKRI